MPRLKALVAVIALSMVGATSALADNNNGLGQPSDTDSSDILGSWTFATKPYRDGRCTMTGSMVLSPDPEDGVYACELTAIEQCDMWGKSVVLQTCSVRRFGNQVSVRSEIAEMLEQKPQTEALLYVPDNFALTVQSQNRMYGSLVSAATAPVEFIRNLDGIS